VSTPAFQDKLRVGRVGEGAIARWLRKRGWFVLPVYDLEMAFGKGPRLLAPDTELIATDMFAFRMAGTSHTAHFVEAKHKTVFSWHRNTGRWTTGIDLHHYEHYLQVDERTPWPVWLLFLHSSNVPDARDVAHGCPPECPTGLFAGELSALKTCENHRSDKHANGMVYWSESKLTKKATLEEVLS